MASPALSLQATNMHISTLHKHVAAQKIFENLKNWSGHGLSNWTGSTGPEVEDEEGCRSSGSCSSEQVIQVRAPWNSIAFPLFPFALSSLCSLHMYHHGYSECMSSPDSLYFIVEHVHQEIKRLSRKRPRFDAQLAHRVYCSCPHLL